VTIVMFGMVALSVRTTLVLDDKRHSPLTHELLLEHVSPMRVAVPEIAQGKLESPLIPTYPSRHDPQVSAVELQGCRSIDEHRRGTLQLPLLIVPVTAEISCETAVGLLLTRANVKSAAIVPTRVVNELVVSSARENLPPVSKSAPINWRATGLADGAWLGAKVGFAVGLAVGLVDGLTVGLAVGLEEGRGVGERVGELVD
jgi:hypothetical protein